MEETWIKIYECKVIDSNTKTWLEEILEENNIPYKKKMNYWKEGKGRSYIYKYEEQVGIYVPDKFKEQVEKYIEEFNSEENMLTDEIEELQTDEDTEVEAKKFAKKQQRIENILIGIVVAMVGALIIATICN